MFNFNTDYQEVTAMSYTIHHQLHVSISPGKRSSATLYNHCSLQRLLYSTGKQLVFETYEVMVFNLHEIYISYKRLSIVANE